MSYSGDPSLSAEIQQRVLATFRQTLDLAAKGSEQEALLGCDFILRLDPQFQPARTLQQQVSRASGAPVDVTALRVFVGDGGALPRAAAGTPGSAGTQKIDLTHLKDLDLDMPDLPAVPAPGTSATDLRGSLERLFATRQFEKLLELADREKRSVVADPAQRALVDQARSRLEAEPYVQKFLDSARQALQVGELDEADRLLKKARALDASHPGLAELEEAKSFYSDPDRAMGARRRGLAGGAPAARPAATETHSAPTNTTDFPDLELPDLDFDAVSEGAGQGLGEEAESAGAKESNGRIQELLDEGQRAFDQGEYQAAIDAWSRIFLIDIDHDEAARRIERARELKAEREREGEEIFHDGVARFDAGDFAGAKEAFTHTLQVQPNYALATEYLEKIAERESGGVAPRAPEPAPRALPATAPATAASRAAAKALAEEILVPPEPGDAGRAKAVGSGFAVAAKKGALPSLSFLAIGGLVLAAVAFGGYWLFTHRARLFPNAQPHETTLAAEATNPIARAKTLQKDGKTAIAIAQLRRLPPSDTHYAEAQTLISQWEALVKAVAPEKPAISLELTARRAALVDDARTAFAHQENLRTTNLLEQAAAIAPLDADQASMAGAAKDKLAPLAKQLALFKQGDFDFLLNDLWHKREANPGDKDVRQMMVDSYYNLGVLDLQRGDPSAAAEKFKEGGALDPADPMMKRLKEFADAYSERGEDLLYRIFVKYLAAR